MTRPLPSDLAIRCGGLILIALAVAACRRLGALGLHGPLPPETVLPYLLALLGFAGASAGSAMVMLGRHLFDRIAVSRLWSSGPAELVDITPPEVIPSRTGSARAAPRPRPSGA